jgi:hypothetical protein
VRCVDEDEIIRWSTFLRGMRWVEEVGGKPGGEREDNEIL